ncbi:MAG: hypothetical protein KDA41_22945, partial [Planctomycetales bacterium]|nr:hypothetical protein [Planctomycetales bacterium]
MFRLCVCCLLLLAAGQLSAQEGAAQRLGEKKPLPSPEQLIEQLSSPEYAQREAAGRALGALGEAARPALEAALRLPHPETRLQARRILELMDEGDFDRALDALLADDAGGPDHALPGWPRFRSLVGRDLASRQLFVLMLRAERDVLTAAQEGKRAAATQLQTRCQQLQVESTADQREIPAGSLATVFFLAGDEQLPEMPGV